MIKKDSKVLYFHVSIPHYAISFFRLVSEAVDIKYVLTEPELAFKVYKNKIPKDELNRLNTQSAKFPKILSLIKCSIREDYNILMVSGLDSVLKIVRVCPGILIAKFRGKKLMYDFMYWEWYRQKQPIPFLKAINRNVIKLLRGPLIRMMDRILVYGEMPKNYLLKKGVDGHRLVNVVNTSAMTEDVDKGYSIRQVHNISSEDIIILYFGRIVPRKGLDVLIQAFLDGGLKDQATLLIVGNGNEKFIDDCKRKAVNCDKIVFTGHMPAEKRFSYFDQSDLFVLPCYPLENAVEPWGLSINEAMQAQTAVLTTDNAGAAGAVLVNGENAVVMDALNLESELGVCLKRLVENSEERDRIGENGKKTFDERLQVMHRFRSFETALASI